MAPSPVYGGGSGWELSGAKWVRGYPRREAQGLAGMTINVAGVT
jgi:hypothetical protein